jgi:hypothetical protein
MTVLGAQTNIQPVYFASDLTVLGTGYIGNILTSNLTTAGNITNMGNEYIGGNITVLGAGVFNNLLATTISSLSTLYVGTSALINNMSIVNNSIDLGNNFLNLGEPITNDFILANTNGVGIKSLNQTQLQLLGDHSQVNIQIEPIAYNIQINSDTLLIGGALNPINSVLLTGNMSISNNLYATNLLGSLLNVNTILASANNSILLSGNLSVTSNLYASNLTVSTLNVNTILAPNNTIIVPGNMSLSNNLSANGIITSGGVNVRSKKTIVYQNQPGDNTVSTLTPTIVPIWTGIYIASGGNLEIYVFLSLYFTIQFSYPYYLYVNGSQICKMNYQATQAGYYAVSPLYAIIPNTTIGGTYTFQILTQSVSDFVEGNTTANPNTNASMYITEY